MIQSFQTVYNFVVFILIIHSFICLPKIYKSSSHYNHLSNLLAGFIKMAFSVIVITFHFLFASRHRHHPFCFSLFFFLAIHPLLLFLPFYFLVSQKSNNLIYLCVEDTSNIMGIAQKNLTFDMKRVYVVVKKREKKIRA